MGFYIVFLGFPGGSDGKESACNVGDLGTNPGLGSSPGEGDRFPTPGFMGFPSGSDDKESTCNAGDLGWEDLEEGMANHSSILASRIPMDRGAWRATVHGISKRRT